MPDSPTFGRDAEIPTIHWMTWPAREPFPIDVRGQGVTCARSHLHGRPSAWR